MIAKRRMNMNNLHLSLIVIFQELNKVAAQGSSAFLTYDSWLPETKYLSMTDRVDQLSLSQIKRHLSDFGITSVINNKQAKQIKRSSLSLIDCLFSIRQNIENNYYTIRRLTSSTCDNNHLKNSQEPLTKREKCWYDIWDVNQCQSYRKSLLESELHGISSVADILGGVKHG